MQFAKKFAPIICALLLTSVTSETGLAQPSMRQISHEQEDNRLYNQMVKVGDWLAQYCVWNHRFPEGLDQINHAKQQLNDLVPNIPYNSGQLQLAGGFDAESDYANPTDTPVESPQPVPVAANMNRIQINSADLSLTDNDIQQYLSQPPSEWNAAPGTITAISNQTTTYVVWAAGRDGLPIRDPDSGRVRLIIGHYGQLYDTGE